MREKKFERMLTFVCGMTLLLYFIGPHITLSLSKGYWVLFRNSNICSTSQSWEGLNEYVEIREASTEMSLKSRLLGVDETGLQQWDTPFGPMWFPSKAAAWTVYFALAQMERGAYPDLRIRKGDIVLDCGGYVGDWTKCALRAGASLVVVVEPAQEALECIRRNLGNEIQEGKVIIYPKAVWDTEGTLYLYHAGDNPAADTVVSSETHDTETIETTTIDEIVSGLQLKRVDVLKMDIEGAEVHALYGAYNTLNRFRPELVVATEHTENWIQNNHKVINAIRDVAPFYDMKCGYCSPTTGTLTPETLYFSP